MNWTYSSMWGFSWMASDTDWFGGRRRNPKRHQASPTARQDKRAKARQIRRHKQYQRRLERGK